MMIKANDINGQQTHLVESGLRALTLKFKKWIEGPAQTGSQANGQSGKRANRQIFIITVAVAILMFLCSYPARGTIVNSTIRHCDDCLNSHFKGLTEPVLNATAAAADPAPQSDCPESVQSVRQIMALTYGTCEALEPFSWALLKKSDGNESFIRNNGTFLKSYSFQPGCNYRNNNGNSCNYITNYNEVKETHPYNRMEKSDECQKNEMQCSGQTCLSTFTLDEGSYAFHNIRNGEIDIFAHKTTGYNNQGPQFLGWNCSEYVTTAMILAGRRLVKPNSNNCRGKKGEDHLETGERQWFPANAYSNLADAGCSCLSTIDITDSAASIEPGDIITLDTAPGRGHVMIVEAVEQPFFRDPDNIADCEEYKIRSDQLQIRLNHSSSTTAGPSSIRFYEYESLRYRQSLTHAVDRYIEECIREDNDKNSKEDCWDEGLQEEYRKYLFSIDQLNDNVGNMWKETGPIFKSDIDRYPRWPTVRKYLSAICKARFHKKRNQSVPSDVTNNLNNTKEVFKVIRHQTEKDGCEVRKSERPKLKHKECLGDCINQEGNQCPVYE